MTQAFPEKFTRLHEGEEFFRAKSIEAIRKSEDLLAHAALIERAMDLIDYFCRQHVAQNEDELTIQLLGIRLFNGSASALKLLLSGYYQTSALQQRDLLETIFLLDYFSTDKTRIARWRESDERARQKDFAPIVVRKALDERDGFTERRREKAYKLLCELAGHPTYAGFRMLAPQKGGDAHCGPFFEFTAFKAVYEELTKHSVQAGNAFIRFFTASTVAAYQTKISFIESQGEWAERFYGRPFDRTQIDELRALLAAVKTR
ncbi:MAG: hypothetical protein BroJett029_26350 [Alphaproteobacteria bacterium]|nr:MAG: hypothetical protein BroJett029_26350 [Alphaproteobacteria bacterium]